MRLKGDQATSRALNRRLLLNHLRRVGPATRSRLAEVSGLSNASISFVTADLIAEGLLIDDSRSPTARGAPLRINYAARNAIGFKVTANLIRGVLTDLSTRVLATIELPLTDGEPQTVVQTITTAIEILRPTTAQGAQVPLIGIGVGLPGMVDSETGLCRYVHRFGWRDVPFGKMLSQALGAPVWIDNDTNAFALAQYLFGRGQAHQSVLAVVLGQGIGCGFVLNGRLYRGAHGLAGEIGHVVAEQSGRLCECGRRGCLEAYCKEPALVEQWISATRRDARAGLTAADMANAAASGEAGALAVLNEAGQRLGRHLGVLVNLFDPGIIVLGGEAIRFGDALFGPARLAVEKAVVDIAPPIVIDWAEDDWERGASALAIQHFFDFEITRMISAF